MKRVFSCALLAVTVALALTANNSAAYLDDNKPPEGFVTLFNGTDLTGWQGNIDMKQRETLPEEKLAALLTERTKTAIENWKVKDGVIHCTGKGGVSLQTVNDYGNFELLVDWKIEKGGDSGIYIRGQPQVQIWDSDNLGENLKDDWGTGSGGLWNNPKKDPAKKPLKKADKPVGEWNRFHITVLSNEVTVKLNGELVVDKGKLLNFWFPDKPAPEKGPIELQIHGDPLWFKNLYIKELP